MTGNVEPLVSVIMPAFNAEPFLAEAVASVCAQTLPDFEVIIIDDCSRDGTLALAQRLASQDPRVRVIGLPVNRGVAAARNRGIAAAKGSWIALLDCDDRYAPDRLRRLIVHAENHRADMVADDLAVFGDPPGVRDAQGLQGIVRAAERIGLQAYLRRTGKWGRRRDPGFLKPVFRAALLGQLRHVYDERLRIGEDDDLVVRLLLSGARYQLLPEALYFYRQHANSLSRQLTLAELEAMVRASERQLEGMAGQPFLVRKAARQRLATRRRAFAFERAVSCLKQRRLWPALGAICRSPSILPLFSGPLRKRIWPQ